MKKPLVAGLALLATGCFRMTIVNGGTEPAPAPVLDGKWRSSAVLDLVPIDTPLALDATCKETGWAKIEQQHTALDYLVDVFLAGWVYESTHVDVYCAKRGTARPAPPAPPAPPPSPTGTPTAPPGTPTAPPLPPSSPPPTTL
jgi:hypothetical protein